MRAASLQEHPRCRFADPGYTLLIGRGVDGGKCTGASERAATTSLHDANGIRITYRVPRGLVNTHGQTAHPFGSGASRICVDASPYGNS